MPTEDETNTTLPQTPPIEAASSLSAFASCPPEEVYAPRQEFRDSLSHINHALATSSAAAEDQHTISHEATPEPDTRTGALVAGTEALKNEHIEDAGAAAESPSPEVGSDSDVRLAQSMATAALGGEEATTLYSARSRSRTGRPLPTCTTSFLRPGSKFRGTQQSDRQVYDVQVEIKDVNLAESFLCGYLRIQGLTDDHPTLTTFFEGEIIGPKYLFKTQHASWNSSEKIDLQHWARFPAWRPLAKSAKSNASFTLKNYLEREHLFMRWKEYFLVPDHRVKSISGASFEGFYYICFDQRQGGVSGIYFHAKSEKYQQLELRHVGDGGCMGAIEFR